MSAYPLLVDDDPDVVLVAERALRRAGFASLETCAGGDEALRFLGLDGDGPGPRQLPAVVFLDLRMPGTDGWEVLEAIRRSERLQDLPVVVVSSSSQPEDVARAYACGANSFVQKRFDASRPGGFLVDAARYWLELNEPLPGGGSTTG